MSKTENVTEITTDDKGTVRGVLDGQKVVQVHCAHGHDYWRISQRGRRPEFCPEHTPVEEAKPTDKIVTTDDEGNEVVEIPSTWEGLSEEDVAFIESLKDENERGKFYYYDRELRKNVTPTSEEKDDMQYVAPSHLNTRERVTYLKTELRDLLRRSQRMAGHRTVVIPEIEEEIAA